MDSASAHLWKAIAIAIPKNSDNFDCTPIAIPSNIVWKYIAIVNTYA